MRTDADFSTVREHSKEHMRIEPNILYVGTPVALVTSLNKDGTTNISPMSSVWAVFDRAVLGMLATSQGCENIERTGELVINFPAPDLWPNVEAIARATGRTPVPPHKEKIGYRFTPDKFESAGLTPQPAQLVRPRRIAECPIQFEARLVACHGPGGDWPRERPETFRIIEAKVVRVYAHQDILVPGTDHIDPAKWSPLLYVFRHYFGTGPDLGKTFKADV